jgi:hypothetical protein
MSKTLHKTAGGRRVIRFRQCHRNCRCGRDPEGGPYFVKRWHENGSRGKTCVPWQEVTASFNALQLEEAENDETLPKTAVGSLHLAFVKCGRPNCRCRHSLLHGPYLYRHWREDGRQRKEYVPMRRLSEVLLEMEEHRAKAARPAQVARVLKGLRHV